VKFRKTTPIVLAAAFLATLPLMELFVFVGRRMDGAFKG
jgi:hypothetical protein